MGLMGTTVVGIVVVSVTPIGRAIARRLGGESPAADAQLAALRDDVSELRRELDEARAHESGQLEELHSRLDFAERLLAQARARGLLAAPKER